MSQKLFNTEDVDIDRHLLREKVIKISGIQFASFLENENFKCCNNWMRSKRFFNAIRTQNVGEVG